MREQLIQYVNLLFAGTTGAEEIKQEILQNTLDRYDDLIAQGKSSEAAYQLAISGIGDINEILPECSLSVCDNVISKTENNEQTQETPVWKRILKAIAISLYILSAIPLLVFQDTFGLCVTIAVVAVATAILLIPEATGKQVNKSEEPEEDSNQPAILKEINALLFTIGLVVFVLVGYLTGAWAVVWVVFPVVAAIKGLIRGIYDYKCNNNMKRNALIRCVLFSVMAFLLICCLLGGLGIRLYSVDFKENTPGYTVTEDNECVELVANIESISVDWASGSVNIQAVDSDTITFSEVSNHKEKHKMVWRQNGNRLEIEYCEPYLSLGFSSIADKDLVINVPKDWVCKDLQLSTASADLMLTSLQIIEADIDSASGECTFQNCRVEELDIETASGSVQFDGILTSLDCDAASAEFTGVFQNTPEKISMDSASGDLNITLPQGAGFRVEMDSLSGRLYSDFEGTYEGDAFVYGDRRCEINFDGASGKISIFEKD